MNRNCPLSVVARFQRGGGSSGRGLGTTQPPAGYERMASRVADPGRVGASTPPLPPLIKGGKPRATRPFPFPPLIRGGLGGFFAGRRGRNPLGNRCRTRRGFTLIELLVVITIILIVSAVALPTVLPAINHRQVSEAARILQGALVGARDSAIHNNVPSGIRLLPDPTYFSTIATTGSAVFGQVDATQILAANRLIPIEPAPEYSEGYVTVNSQVAAGAFSGTSRGSPNPLAYWYFNGTTWVSDPNYPNYPILNVRMVEQSYYVPGPAGQPNPPTSWYWNIRIGDQIQINNAGPWYTVVGPMAIPPGGVTLGGVFYANPEMFVNVGPPGVTFTAGNAGVTGTSPLVRINGNFTSMPDFLFVVNGQDDNRNGWVDEGWDGVDNDGDGLIDEQNCTLFPGVGEWQETEQWLGTLATSNNAVFATSTPPTNLPYTIRRRPVPVAGAREIALPSGVVVDLTTWGSTLERSRIPAGALNPFTGYVDIMINPDGTVLPTTIYSSPSSAGLGGAFYHFWLAERGDLYPPSGTIAPALPVTSDVSAAAVANWAGLRPANRGAALYPNGAVLKGEFRLVTLFARTGEIATTDNVSFLDSYGNYNPNNPYIQAQQGVQGRSQ